MPRYLDDRSALRGARLKTQLRLGCLPLMRQTTRQLGWPEDGAVCPLCDTGAVEDTPHFLQCCPAFSRERQVLLAILKDRLTTAGSPGSTALSQFVGGGEQQLLLMLGAKPRFLTPKQLEEEDEEEREVRLQNQGKAWWTLDKACKNFVRVCWRRRNHIIGKHYIAKRTLVLQTEPKEVVWKDDSPITIGPLRPLGTRRPWSTWVQRASTSMWTNSHRTNGRKANFFAVWRGKKSGVFYKWSDCKAALRGHMDPGFKGYRTLQEAYDGLRENLSRLKMAAER